MIIIHLAALSGILLMGACWIASGRNRPAPGAGGFAALFLAALALRLAAAALSKGFGTDTACFAAWAERIWEVGPGGFYDPDVFSDYPPGYLYVLWLLDGVRRLLGIEHYSAAHLVLLKLPSILCDLACGWLLCREAAKRLSGRHAFFLCAAYLFHPVILLNSSVWGQVDSLTALAAVFLCVSLIRGRMYPAYIAFGLGLLVKPQMLLLGPVLLVGTIDRILASRRDGSGGRAVSFLPELLHCLFQCLSVALGGVILCLPFGLAKVAAQLLDTLGSYPYAAVNACNLWGLLGLNWVSQDNAFWGIPYRHFGALAIAAAVVLTVLLGLRGRGSKDRYPFLAAFTAITVFLFSVRMHERYLYPALALLMLAYICRPAPGTYVCLSCFGALHFCNTAWVLFFYDPGTYDRRSASILLVSAGMLFCGALFYRTAYRHYGGQDRPESPPLPAPALQKGFPGTPPRRSPGRLSLNRADILCMLAVTAVYGCFALYDLGERQAPVTRLDMVQGQSIELSFGSGAPASLSYYIAPWQDRTFLMEGKGESDRNWSYLGELSMQNVFTWQETVFQVSAAHLRLTLQDAQAAPIELVFRDAAGNILVPENASDYPALFDEQELYPDAFTFRNGMYFDEIYHGRTAYEFLHGLTSYENTHPPLGKIFIAMGVALFGMNPFGWRIMGTIFGIAMVPVVYLFARRIARETLPAALACMLFAFDFMHFTQTRIATIDTYVTFFVILMYLFMYRYVTLSFYDTPLKKTWLPLGACGVCMGLGIASKWTGIYAGAGLGLLFFSALYRRYREYLYAKADPEGQSGGISHAHILRCFRGYAWRTIAFCLVFFVAVPAAIYLLSYLPFRDYGDKGLLGRMLYNQRTMFSYHSNLVSDHPYASAWYEWPVISRPIWYYSRVVTQTAQGGLREGISAFGNPAVWWAGIPAFLYMVWLWLGRKDRNAAFLTVGYLAQYLPWFFVTRDTFIYHYFPSVAFVVLMVMYGLLQWKRRVPRRLFFLTAALYGMLAFALFLLFYPVLAGQPVEASFVARYLRWLPGWVLTAR